MKRTFASAIAALALTAGAPAPVSVHVTVARASLQLLDTLNVTVGLFCTSKAQIVLHFPSADEYDLQLVRGSEVVWDYEHDRRPVPIAHTRPLPNGFVSLGTFVWNELAGGKSIEPGTYQLRVTLLDGAYHASTQVPVRFVAPLPIGALASYSSKTAVTVTGTLSADGMALHDASGTIALDRRIVTPPDVTTIVTRGYLQHRTNGTIFFAIDRWAPMATSAP